MKKKRARIQVLDSDSESSFSESSHGASSEEDDESVAADSGKDHGKYKIPKMAKAGPWSKTQIEGFKTNLAAFGLHGRSTFGNCHSERIC